MEPFSIAIYFKLLYITHYWYLLKDVPMFHSIPPMTELIHPHLQPWSLLSPGNLLNLVVLLLLAVVLGLGLMNMVIGVLCESALGLQAKDEAELQRGDLITFLTQMKTLQEVGGDGG